MYSQRNTYIIIAAAVLVAVVVGYISYSVHKDRSPDGAGQINQNIDQNTGMDLDITTLTYASDKYGMIFNYPSNYTLTQKEITDAKDKTRNHHAITLTSTKALENIPQNGEGPTAITIDIYANPKNTLTQDWIKNSPDSNYKLAVDPTMHEATLGGANAYAYTWSGLYNGNSFVFAHKKNIIMASVTYLTPEDAILNDFTQIMSTVQLR